MNLQICTSLDEPRQFTAAKANSNRTAVALLRLGCIAMLLAAPVSMQGAVEIFMRIGGQAAAMGSQQTVPVLAGESTDPRFPNWIPVLAMSHGISQSGSVGGGGSGKANHQDVSFTKNLDRTTPSVCFLINNITNVTAGLTQPIDYVTIDFRKAGTTEVFYRMEMQQVSLSSVSYGGSAGGDSLTDNVSFNYTKIRWTYQAYVAGKANGQPITTGWDVAKNAPY